MAHLSKDWTKLKFNTSAFGDSVREGCEWGCLNEERERERRGKKINPVSNACQCCEL